MSYNTARPARSRILTVLTPHQRLAEGAVLRGDVVPVCVVLVGVLKETDVALVVLIVCVVLVGVLERAEEALEVLAMDAALVCAFKEAEVKMPVVVRCVRVCAVLGEGEVEVMVVVSDAVVFMVLGCVVEAGMEVVMVVWCVIGVVDVVYAMGLPRVVVEVVRSI